ncbi:5'-methylthioadenosine/S-adenosylhomocysteine nucleosidase [Thermopolyspora sp. NPDC052614]|uniref:5'-methylthioadenosine/S-adenosylhomocysteine nucleosidase family protein n=1 Tax=Thermopolyspora sp. NPDC052614 TaxID=3155682 RepID=UPI0034267C20
MSDRHVVILTALDLEYQAVRRHLAAPGLHRHPHGTLFEVGRLASGRCRVALANVGTGNQAAAVLTERAIREFDPAALLFVGVAGALSPHIALGDVVVATRVYAYHGGKSEDDGLRSRPRSWETSHAAEQLARHIGRDGGWAGDLDGPAPQVHFGPIAAGEVVLNSKVSGHARWIEQNYNDAYAIEMEGAGVAQAAHLNGALPMVVIRGVSDRADGTKEITDRDRWQERAAANAAAFAAALAEAIGAEDERGRWPKTAGGTAMRVREDAHEGDRHPAGVTYHNVAQGNAQVGIQVGQVHGDINYSVGQSRPEDLVQALTKFRSLLRRARADGRLDEETFAAAEEELAIADDALRAETPQSKGKLTLALKRLRGLLADAADLAGDLTTIITLAQALR